MRGGAEMSCYLWSVHCDKEKKLGISGILPKGGVMAVCQGFEASRVLPQRRHDFLE